MDIPFEDLKMWHDTANREPFTSAYKRALAAKRRGKEVVIRWLETDLITVKEIDPAGNEEEAVELEVQAPIRRRVLVEEAAVRRRSL